MQRARHWRRQLFVTGDKRESRRSSRFFQFGFNACARCPHIIILYYAERGGCCVRCWCWFRAGVSLHQFRAHTAACAQYTAKVAMATRGVEQRNKDGALEDSAAKAELRHFAWTAAPAAEINDVLQQTSFNGAIFFSTPPFESHLPWKSTTRLYNSSYYISYTQFSLEKVKFFVQIRVRFLNCGLATVLNWDFICWLSKRKELP